MVQVRKDRFAMIKFLQTHRVRFKENQAIYKLRIGKSSKEIRNRRFNANLPIFFLVTISSSALASLVLVHL